MFPAVNDRMPNSDRWNIGCGTRRSITTKTARTTTPPMRQTRTVGLVQPMTCPP